MDSENHKGRYVDVAANYESRMIVCDEKIRGHANW